EGDTVLHGPFEMQQSDLSSLLNDRDDYFSCQGVFENNRPVGKWIFRFGSFQVGKRTNLEDYAYKVELEGSLHHAEGFMMAGKPNGEWVHRVERIAESEVSGTIFKSTIVFDKGIPQRSFRIDNQNYSLLGRFLRDGIAHDTWSLYANETAGLVESWQFNDGSLNQIVRPGEETDTVDTYAATEAEEKVLTLDQRYIRILRLHQQIMQGSDTLISTTMYDLLDQNAQYYELVDQVLKELSKASFTPEFKVKVADFPLSEEEVNQLSSMASKLKKSEIITQRLLESPQLNILKLADEEVSFKFSVVETIDKEWLEPIRKVVKYNAQNILTSVRRSDFIQYALPDRNDPYSLKITYTINESPKVKIFDSPLLEDTSRRFNGISRIEEFSKSALESLESIQRELDRRILKQERQEELEKLEELLYKSIKSLNQGVDSLSSLHEDNLSQVIMSLKTSGRSLVSDYSELDQLPERIERAGQLISCLDSASKLASNVSQIPEKSKEIAKSYMDRVWNPFTSTLMDEEIKKPIITAYQDVIVPYLLDRVQADLTCEDIDELNLIFEGTYDRLIALRGENTKKLEKRLRRENKPDQVFQLLKIPTHKSN
ncbi:MAG: hypothetical protein AAF519_06370, partial [Bacteroidota bacterium]